MRAGPSSSPTPRRMLMSSRHPCQKSAGRWLCMVTFLRCGFLPQTARYCIQFESIGARLLLFGHVIATLFGWTKTLSVRQQKTECIACYTTALLGCAARLLRLYALSGVFLSVQASIVAVLHDGCLRADNNSIRKIVVPCLHM